MDGSPGSCGHLVHPIGHPGPDPGCPHHRGLTLIAKCSNEAPHTHTVTLVKGTPATCTAMGVTTYTATVEFGKHTYTATKAVTDISMEDHQYVDGVCTVCGAKDPDYVEPTQKPQATDKPAATQQPDTVPPTGDAGQLMVYVAAMGAAALLMGAAVAVRKRKEG